MDGQLQFLPPDAPRREAQERCPTPATLGRNATRFAERLRHKRPDLPESAVAAAAAGMQRQEDVDAPEMQRRAEWFFERFGDVPFDLEDHLPERLKRRRGNYCSRAWPK